MKNKMFLVKKSTEENDIELMSSQKGQGLKTNFYLIEKMKIDYLDNKKTQILDTDVRK